MKLGKEEIQKLALGVLLLIGVVYSYFDMLLFPELRKQEAIRKNIESLTPEIAKATSQIKRTQELEKSAPAKTQIVPQVEAMIPDGAPVAWFPPRVSEFFKRHNIDKVAARMNTETVEKELPGFRRITWTIDLPKVDFISCGKALCALENEDPIVEITSLHMETSQEDVESQRVLITVNNLAKQ
jgi:hypothetical protein